ncbi:hypothetical protein RRG08_045510 [Elysia crispata]|uniref:Uncharacterized protein n=1 Tax=Elysia crispata TaxID=231223 RepID=A0AAE1ADW8_9GAST|nr:hypothetical protein RRG08_045510 [Elysia crispata]
MSISRMTLHSKPERKHKRPRPNVTWRAAAECVAAAIDITWDTHCESVTRVRAVIKSSAVEELCCCSACQPAMWVISTYQKGQ